MPKSVTHGSGNDKKNIKLAPKYQISWKHYLKNDQEFHYWDLP